MYVIQKIEVFKDTAIPTAEGIRVFCDDPDLTEFSYNPHEETMGIHKQGFPTIWQHDLGPNLFWTKVNLFLQTGKVF